MGKQDNLSDLGDLGSGKADKIDSRRMVWDPILLVSALGNLSLVKGLDPFALHVEKLDPDPVRVRHFQVNGCILVDRIWNYLKTEVRFFDLDRGRDYQVQVSGIQAEVEAVRGRIDSVNRDLRDIVCIDIGLVRDNLIGAIGQIANGEIAVGIGGNMPGNPAIGSILDEQFQARNRVPRSIILVGPLADQATDESRATRIQSGKAGEVDFVRPGRSRVEGSGIVPNQAAVRVGRDL